MHERLAALDRRIAEAADAWLTDPRDAGVYARLVDAVQARRAYLNPTLDETEPPEAVDALPEPITLAPTQLQADEVLDALGHSRPAHQVLADLDPDPRALLDRLRRGAPRG